MDDNRSPMATTHHGDDSSRASKTPEIRTVNQVQENSRTANDCLNQIVDLFTQNQIKVDETLVPFSTEFRDLLAEKKTEKLDEEIKNYSDPLTPEKHMILEEVLQNSPTEIDFLMEFNNREEAKKKFIIEVLEIEKNMETGLNYEQQIQRMVKSLEDHERANNMKPISMTEKLVLVDLMRRVILESLQLDIKEVPFGAESTKGPIGDLMREIDSIFNRITEIGDSSRLQEEKKLLIQRTRVILFNIKMELNKTKISQPA